MVSWPWNGEWSPVFDREKHIISKYTNIHDSKNPYYTEVLDIFTDGEQEARVKTQQWLTKRMRQKRNEKRQSQRHGEERDRGATNDRLQKSSSYGKMKKKKRYESKLRNPRKPHRRRDGREKKNSTRKKVVGCQTGVEAPCPTLPKPTQPIPSPTPPPLPSLAEGESTWAQDGVETRRNTSHTDGGWATDLACSPYGTPVEVSRVHLTKGGIEGKTTVF